MPNLLKTNQQKVYSIVLFLHFIFISSILVILTKQFNQYLFNQYFYFFNILFIVISSGFMFLYYLIINYKKINSLMVTCAIVLYSLACLYCMAFSIKDNIISNIYTLLLFFILIYIMHLLVDELSLNNKRLFYYNFVLFMPSSIFTLIALYFKEKLLTNTSTKLHKISIILLNIFIVFTFIVSITIFATYLSILHEASRSWNPEPSLFNASLLYTSLLYIINFVFIYLFTKYNKKTDFITIGFIIFLFYYILNIVHKGSNIVLLKLIDIYYLIEQSHYLINTLFSY